MPFALRRPRRWNLSGSAVAAAIIAPLCLATLYGAIVLAGTRKGELVALAALVGPVAAYFAITEPFVFPFCLFVLLVPLDNLLDVSSFGTVTKLLGIVSAAAILLWVFRSRSCMRPGKALIAWAAFMVVAVASLMWAIDPGQTAGPLTTLLGLFALYAIVSMAPIDARTLTTVLWTVILGGVVAAAYGIYLFHSGVDMSHGRLFISAADSAGAQSKIDPNHFAASLLVPIAIGLVAFSELRGFGRIAAFAALVIMGTGVAFAGSRGAVLALAAILLYLLIRSSRRIAIAASALACIGGALAYHAAAISRFSQALATGGAGRFEIWKVGAVAFVQHPVLGAGFGNFQPAYNAAFMAVSLTKNIYWSQAPHSNLVWIAVELGAVGLLIFLYAWWEQFRTLRGIAPYEPLFPVRLAVEAGIIGLFVASLFLGTFTYKYLWLAFMLAALTRNAWVEQHAQLRRSTP